MSKQTLFSTVRSPSRRARRKQQRLRPYPSVWLEWLRSYLKKLKRHRTQTLNQPIFQRTILINTTTRSTTTQSKRSPTQKINSRQQLWTRLRQQPLLDDGGLRFAGGTQFMSQQGVTQLASTQWIARPLMPVEPAKNSSLLGHYSLRLSLMLPIVTHGLVSRRWRLPSIRPLGSSSSVKLTAIDWAVPMWQSLKSGRKSGMRGWFSCETANLPVRPMAGTEIVPLPPVVSHQTVSPPPSSEKTNLSSSKTPPTSQFPCRMFHRAGIDSAYPSSNFSNHRQLSSGPPIKRRKLGRAPGAFAEVIREPTLFSQVIDSVTMAQTLFLSPSPAKFQPLGSVDRLAGAKYIHNDINPSFTLSYQSKKPDYTRQLLNKFVDTTNDISEISAQKRLLEPHPGWIRLKRTVSSTKNSNNNQTSPATAESFLATDGTDILPMNHQTVSPPSSSEKANPSSSKIPLTSQLIYKNWFHVYIDFVYSSSNFSNHHQLSRERPIATSESIEAASGTDILPTSQNEFLFWKQYYKPLILNLAGDPEYMEFLQSTDSTADINQLLQRVTAFAEVYHEHRAKQAQVTQSLGGTQPAITQRMAILCLKEDSVLNER
ncbi:MAG: hypothetical protein AB2992_06265 [Candidatus Symbiodolus clandestinus]